MIVSKRIRLVASEVLSELSARTPHAGDSAHDLAKRAKRKESARAKDAQTRNACPSVARPAAIPELIRVPKHWFMLPLRQAMRLRVRPVTSNTRRKQLCIKMQVS